jgi:hypothetical protein
MQRRISFDYTWDGGTVGGYMRMEIVYCGIDKLKNVRVASLLSNYISTREMVMGKCVTYKACNSFWSVALVNAAVNCRVL